MSATPKSVHTQERPLDRAKLEEARRCCNALDGLVRASRVDPRNAERLCPRITEQVRQLPGRLELRARTVVYDGIPVLGDAEDVRKRAGDDRWTLAAFMAGLRAIGPSPNVTEEQLLGFAIKLGELTVTVSSLDGFRDYLWAEGAVGLQLDVAPSFVEVASALEVAGRASGGIGVVRAFAAFSEDGVVMKPMELDVAAADEAFDVPVEPLRSAWQHRTCEPSSVDVGELRAAVEPAAAWAYAELRLALDVPSARVVLDPPRVARRLLGMLAGDVGSRELERVEVVLASEDEFARAVAASSDSEGLGAQLARAAPLGDPSVTERLGRLLDGRLGPAARRGLLRDLAIVGAPGAGAVLTQASLRGFAVEVVQAVASEEAPPDAAWLRVRHALERANNRAAAALWVCSAPIPMIAEGCAALDLVPLGEDADAFLASLAPPRLTAVAEVAMREGWVPPELLGFLRTHVKDFESKTLYALLSRCLHTPPGLDAIRALANDRRAPDDARIAALEVGATSEALATELLSTRISNVLDSDAVRLRRKALRKERANAGRRT